MIRMSPGWFRGTIQVSFKINVQNCCHGTYCFAPQTVPKAAWRTPTGSAGIFGSVEKKKKKTLGFICIFGLSLKSTFVHKQTLCGQTTGGLGCGEKKGREGARKEGEGQ